MRSSPAKASVICVPIDAMRHEGRGDEADEEDVHDEVAESHLPGEDGLAAEPDHQHADDADDDGAAGGGRGDAGHRLRDVAEQAMRAFGEDDLLALLRGVRLDHANAAEGLGQAPDHVGGDLAALLEQRAQCAERVRHPAAESREHEHGHHGQVPVQPEQDGEPHGRGEEAAHQLHQPGPNQVPDPFGVVHDPRDEDAGLGGVEVADGQAHDPRLDALAHVGDRALGRHPQGLREHERGDGLHQGRRTRGQGDGHEQFRAVLADDLVDQPLRGGGEHQARHPADQHQTEAETQTSPMRPDQLARLAPGGRTGHARLLQCLHEEAALYYARSAR